MRGILTYVEWDICVLVVGTAVFSGLYHALACDSRLWRYLCTLMRFELWFVVCCLFGCGGAVVVGLLGVILGLVVWCVVGGVVAFGCIFFFFCWCFFC